MDVPYRMFISANYRG